MNERRSFHGLSTKALYSSQVLYVPQGVRAANLACGTYDTKLRRCTSVRQSRVAKENIGLISLLFRLLTSSQTQGILLSPGNNPDNRYIDVNEAKPEQGEEGGRPNLRPPASSIITPYGSINSL